MITETTKLRSISTGPRTKAGKKVASMNATKHGLTAKNWLNKQEQERYQSLLDSLIEEHEPQTPTENLLVERVANIATRLNRFQSVEDTLFALAREKAVDFDNVLNFYELDDETASDAANATLGILDRSDDFDAELCDEFPRMRDLNDVSGYGYVLEHMP